MSLIEDIKQDAESGTPGPWRSEETGPVNSEEYGNVRANVGVWSEPEYEQALEEPDDDGDDAMDAAWVCGIWGNPSEASNANARRIARVPDMEAALLAADDLDLILAEVEALKPERHADPEGAYHVTMPAGEWETLQDDIARVRAAYRAAVEAKP